MESWRKYALKILTWICSWSKFYSRNDWTRNYTLYDSRYEWTRRNFSKDRTDTKLFQRLTRTKFLIRMTNYSRWNLSNNWPRTRFKNEWPTIHGEICKITGRTTFLEMNDPETLFGRPFNPSLCRWSGAWDGRKSFPAAGEDRCSFSFIFSFTSILLNNSQIFYYSN